MVRIVRKETRKRGFFGWIFLLLFVAFNVMMAFWIVSYWATVAPMAAGGDAAAAGAAIGATIGTGLILGIWMTGTVILGIFVLISRGRKIIVEETTQSSPSWPAQKMVLLGAEKGAGVPVRHRRHSDASRR